MKKALIFIVLFLLTGGLFKANAQTTVNFPDIGEDMMPDYPAVEWIKGPPVSHFDKDKIYVIELWATWCIPCIAAMPHLNALSQKFKDKVVFVGQDVMETNKAKVEAFVKEKGDGLSFSIAYAGGDESDFYNKWIKPAGITAIPQTFVIQNNKLAWHTDPMSLNEKVLQLLVDGKFTIDAAKAVMNKQ